MSVLKPHRANYYFPNQIVNGKAELYATIVMAYDKNHAQKVFAEHFPTATLVRTYRSYRKLSPRRQPRWVEVTSTVNDVIKDLGGMLNRDGHERLMETFKTEDTESLTPGQIQAVHNRDTSPCPWHGTEYMKPDGRCGALDPGSSYFRRLFRIPDDPPIVEVKPTAPEIPCVFHGKAYSEDKVVDLTQRVDVVETEKGFEPDPSADVVAAKQLVARLENYDHEPEPVTEQQTPEGNWEPAVPIAPRKRSFWSDPFTYVIGAAASIIIYGVFRLVVR